MKQKQPEMWRKTKNMRCDLNHLESCTILTCPPTQTSTPPSVSLAMTQLRGARQNANPNTSRLGPFDLAPEFLATKGRAELLDDVEWFRIYE